MPKILIVEDDPLTAKLYRDFLARGGYEVEIAIDGSSGLDQAQALAPDGILVDLMMPGINGVEFVKRLRALPQFQKIPILAFTTAFVPQFIAQAKAAGATEVYDKAKLNGALIKAAFQQYMAT